MTDIVPQTEDALIDAALEIIAAQGWRVFNLPALARAAGQPLAAVYRLLPDRAAVLGAYLRRLGARALEGPEIAAEGPPRDRLFDAVMQVFDAALPAREAIRVLAIDLRADPLTVLALRREAARLAAVTLARAGIAADGFLGAARVAGLIAVMLQLARVWVDDTDDQARTMAALDRRLRRAGRLLGAGAEAAQPQAQATNTVH